MAQPWAPHTLCQGAMLFGATKSTAPRSHDVCVGGRVQWQTRSICTPHPCRGNSRLFCGRNTTESCCSSLFNILKPRRKCCTPRGVRALLGGQPLERRHGWRAPAAPRAMGWVRRLRWRLCAHHGRFGALCQIQRQPSCLVRGGAPAVLEQCVAGPPSANPPATRVRRVKGALLTAKHGRAIAAVERAL